MNKVCELDGLTFELINQYSPDDFAGYVMTISPIYCDEDITTKFKAVRIDQNEYVVHLGFTAASKIQHLVDFNPIKFAVNKLVQECLKFDLKSQDEIFQLPSSIVYTKMYLLSNNKEK